MHSRFPSLASALALGAVALSTAPAAAQQAAAPAKTIQWYARMGLEGGGEKVLQFQYSDGSTPDMTAGGGVLLAIGGAYPLWAEGTRGVDARMSAGLKWRTIPEATNQTANWLRFPVEAMVNYRSAAWNFGAGATLHLMNELKASGDAANGTIEFSSGPGIFGQVEYRRQELGVDLRYTKLEYDVENGSGSVDASHVTLGFSYYFKRRAAAPAGN